MKRIYQVLGIALILFGLWSIFNDINSSSHMFFRGIGAMIAFGLILLGTQNLLNVEYGAIARGVKYCAIGGNLGWVILLVVYGNLPRTWDEWLGYILSVLILLASLAYERIKPRVDAA